MKFEDLTPARATLVVLVSQGETKAEFIKLGSPDLLLRFLNGKMPAATKPVSV